MIYGNTLFRDKIVVSGQALQRFRGDSTPCDYRHINLLWRIEMPKKKLTHVCGGCKEELPSFMFNHGRAKFCFVCAEEQQQTKIFKKAWYHAQLVFFRLAKTEIAEAARIRQNGYEVAKNMKAAGCATLEEWEAYKKSGEPQKKIWRDKGVDGKETRRRRDQWKNVKRIMQGKAKGRRIPAGALNEMLERQEGKCNACSVEVGNDYHIDHIYPLARGGVNELWNLQILCPPCNQSKSDNIVT
jgi:hypothetical protein